MVAGVERAAPVSLEPRPAEIPEQADHGRNVEQDEARRPLQPLRQTSRVIAVHHPSFRHDRRIMQRDELGLRAAISVLG